MKELNWGIVGTGRICDKFCRALTEHTNGTQHVAAVFSRTAEKGKKFASRFGCDQVYTDLAAMCECENIDVVYIGTPHPCHGMAVMTAVSAGKHVLCEKPMTLNAAHARACFEEAQKNEVFLMEAMWTRFLPAVVKACEWINSGSIGEVVRVTADFHGYNEENTSSRLFALELGGGSLLDLGVYPIFAANLFLHGAPEVVHTEMTAASTGVDKYMTAQLRYENGDAFISSGFDRNTCCAVIEGTNGMVVIPNWCYAHSAYLYRNGELAESFSEPRENGMEYEAMHVAECIEKGMTTSPVYPPEMTMRELDCCDRLRSQWGLRYPGDDQRVTAMGKSAPQTLDSISDVRVTGAVDWYRDASFYHIYPLGMFGAPEYNDFTSAPTDRLGETLTLVDHIANSGFNAVYFGPLFESTRHGYDTADYRVIDRRLGTNDQFRCLCAALHARGVRVVVDGVFNHVGRDFWAFKDVQQYREGSRYKDWFHINFGGNSNYNDGFYYDGWEGHYELVRLNLRNPDVKNYLFDTVRSWINEFGIDGLRLDVAYCLDHDFMRELHNVCRSVRQDFFLLGECVHGDYNQYVNDAMLDSVTNYECYKGIHSSINEGNMHEIGYSLHRQFGNEHWCLYRGKNLYNFVDNHDVSRIASILRERDNLSAAYALMYSMPGIPSVYYGSEFAFLGDKSQGDGALRPMLTGDDIHNMRNSLTDYIARLNEARRQSKALRRGDYNQLYVRPKQLIFARSFEDERVICAINVDSEPHTAHFDAQAGRAYDLITGQTIDFGGGLVIPPRSALIGRVY